MDDDLILVDEDDREIGTGSKADCHAGSGILHRAFSLFLFNEKGEVLIQQRSREKFLWPLYWSNSCCSHPRSGETVEQAAERRMREELGTCAELRFLFKFSYHARFADVGSERELCWVLAGRPTEEIQSDPAEVANWSFVTPADLTQAIKSDGERFTPWMKLEWPRVAADVANGVSW
jgi:isopentenyl-diphosphate delta-isomerase